MPTVEIVTTLANLGIQVDEARFREQALAHKTVDGLADAWLAQSTATGIWEDYPWLAARALWPRWGPDLFSVDVFIAQHLSAEAFGAGDEPMTVADAERHWRMAQAVMDLVAPKTGLVRPELLEELSEHASLHVGWWLSDLPSSLAQLGMVDQAAEICARMATVEHGDTYLGDRAMILAEAGRREAALEQVEEILARFPDDPWVRLTAGDVHEALGDLAAAEATYRQALALTDALGPSSERSAAVERLMDLLQKAGRTAELVALFESRESRDVAFAKADFAGYEYEEVHDTEDGALPADEVNQRAPGPGLLTTRHPARKVGRNEPCPCGSGQKFKRCCGR